jgi:hypothetical protein
LIFFPKMIAFWNVALCSLVDISEEITASIISAMEAITSSETSINIYQTACRNIPEGSRLHTRRENVKSHIFFSILRDRQFKGDCG